ncbi:PREDICTED: heat stress transcription factor A-4c-like [Camelina sativa]|uniref:Heat stress transcription factor A-4c-like n=1 Tax=Camelina sativa TaxID=90675 RepID=A0ABM0ST03_CAMSA|nr:PREDICTED: heat stress transcription factor A-4c-like [Camelina sativa]
MAYNGYPKSGLRFYEGVYEMVDDPSSDSIISWSKSNKSFVIRNQQELIRRKMLSRFFCRNLTEFISKLKFSGFKQMNRSSGLWEFGDKNFVRGRPELMVEMHKRVSMARITERCSNQMKAKAQLEEGFQNLSI